MPVEISFVKPHAETKAGLERVVEQAHVGPVVAVTLLHAQRIEDAIAARPDVHIASGGQQAIPDLAGPSGLGVELPSELADVGHPLRQDRKAADVDVAGVHEGERLLGDVVPRDASEHLARLRSPDAQHRDLV